MKHPTPLLDQLETGRWPSFVTGLKRLAEENPMIDDMLGQLETSYETRFGYWKGGTVGVIGYGGGIIPRFTELKNPDGTPKFPEAAEFHTLRVQPPAGMHYTSDLLRNLCDAWVDSGGSGLIALHGQSGDIMFQGVDSAHVQEAFDRLNALGFDLGGAGPALRTSMSCVGAARCEMSNYDEARALRTVINNNLDDMHRPSLPYKFKFKFSGCPNDCVNAIQRSDMATIGLWRDNIQTNEERAKDWMAAHSMNDLVNMVVSLCPTKAITLRDAGTPAKAHESVLRVGLDTEMAIDNHNCVRCMHCLNVMPGALLPGKDKGVTVLIGGKGVLKIGATMGTVIVPFMKLESDEDFEKLNDLARKVLDFFAENALDHERTGEMIERIGLVNFLEGIGLEVDPNMIIHPRTNPYARMDGWEEEAQKWFERKAAEQTPQAKAA
jgi:sulfite reductase alpha subunit